MNLYYIDCLCRTCLMFVRLNLFGPFSRRSTGQGLLKLLILDADTQDRRKATEARKPTNFAQRHVFKARSGHTSACNPRPCMVDYMYILACLLFATA